MSFLKAPFGCIIYLVLLLLISNACLYGQREQMKATNQQTTESHSKDLQAKTLESMEKVNALERLLALANEKIASRDEIIRSQTKDIASRDEAVRSHVQEIALRDATVRSHAQEIQSLQISLSKYTELLAQSEKDKRTLETQHASALASMQADCLKTEKARATLEDTVRQLQLQGEEASQHMAEATAQCTKIACQIMTWNEQLEDQPSACSASNTSPASREASVVRLLAKGATDFPVPQANKEHVGECFKQLVCHQDQLCKEHDRLLQLRLSELNRSQADLEALQTSNKAFEAELAQCASWVRLLVNAVSDIAKPTVQYQESGGRGPAYLDTLMAPDQVCMTSPSSSTTCHIASLAEDVNQALRTAAALLQERSSHTCPDNSCRKHVSEATKSASEKLKASEALVQAAQAELADLRISEAATKSALLVRERRIACLEESLALITSITEKQEEAIREACSAKGKLQAEKKQLLDEKVCATADLEAALKELEDSRDELETANARISDLHQHIKAMEVARTSLPPLQREGQIQATRGGRHLLQYQSEKGISAMTRPLPTKSTAFDPSCSSPAMMPQSPTNGIASVTSPSENCSGGYSAQSNFEAAQMALETMRCAIAQAAQAVAEGKASKQQNLSLASKLQDALAELEEAQNLRKKDVEEIQMLQDRLAESINHVHDKAALEAARALARELEEELHCSNQAVQDLQQELAFVQRSLQAERNRVQHLQSTIAELEREIADSRKKESCLEADNLRTKGALRDQAHEVERGLSQIKGLQEQLASTRDDLSRTKAANLESDSTISSQQTQIQRLENDLYHLQLREKQSAERIADLEHEHRSRHVSMEKLDENLTLTQRHAQIPTCHG